MHSNCPDVLLFSQLSCVVKPGLLHSYLFCVDLLFLWLAWVTLEIQWCVGDRINICLDFIYLLLLGSGVLVLYQEVRSISLKFEYYLTWYDLHLPSSLPFNSLYLCQEQLLLCPFFLLQRFTLVSNIPTKDTKVSLVSIFNHIDMLFFIVRKYFLVH